MCSKTYVDVAAAKTVAKNSQMHVRFSAHVVINLNFIHLYRALNDNHDHYHKKIEIKMYGVIKF